MVEGPVPVGAGPSPYPGPMREGRDGPRRVGLTGGIAAGKSVVATRLTELGATLIDHDRIARAVVEPGSACLSALVAVFGDGILDADGRLDRSALAALVFDDPHARTTLNGIVHPAVAAAAADEETDAVRSGAVVVVHDIPLLVETGQAGRFDEVVVVHAPAAVRVQRLIAGRGLSPEQAWARLAAQADDGTRLAVADVVLDGSGEVEQLRAEVDRLWTRWSTS